MSTEGAAVLGAALVFVLVFVFVFVFAGGAHDASAKAARANRQTFKMVFIKISFELYLELLKTRACAAKYDTFWRREQLWRPAEGNQRGGPKRETPKTGGMHKSLNLAPISAGKFANSIPVRAGFLG